MRGLSEYAEAVIKNFKKKINGVNNKEINKEVANKKTFLEATKKLVASS